MKKLPALIILLLVTATTVLAQSGIYRTPKDYEMGIRFYRLVCPDSSSTSMVRFLRSKFVEASDGTSKMKFNRNEIFGYKDCRGRDYRIFEGVHYEILESDVITLYRLTYTPHEKLKYFTYHAPGEYFFSTSIDSDVRELNRENFELAYQAKPELLEELFQNVDACLYCYDTYHHTYAINYFLKEHERD